MEEVSYNRAVRCFAVFWKDEEPDDVNSLLLELLSNTFDIHRDWVHRDIVKARERYNKHVRNRGSIRDFEDGNIKGDTKTTQGEFKKIYDYNSDEPLEDIADELGIKLTDTEYRSERVDELWYLSKYGYVPLAWTPNVRYLYYNIEEGILIRDIEGDITIWKNPPDEFIEAELQKYPKSEISHGELYDSRF